MNEERLREILQEPGADPEKLDLAHDALICLHSESAKTTVISELRNTLKVIEERRPYLRNRPRITLQTRQAIKTAWEKATPAPWATWAQQPSVVIFHSNDEQKTVASIDTWSGRGVFDADAMVLARTYLLSLLEELDVFEQQEETRWRIITKTTPSGKTLFVCLACGRESVTPDKTCTKTVTIATGGSAAAEILDCVSAYRRRPR